MKTALKLVLIYFLLVQFVAPFLMMVPYAIYFFATTGDVNQDLLMKAIIIPSQLAGQIMMGVYLWKAGYISRDKAAWSPISVSYLLVSAITMLICGFLISSLMSVIDWKVPNIMEEVFAIFLSSWGGIFVVAIAGPLLEELLFRGAITQALLRRYSPDKAIMFSALLFGVFHINPAQIFPAFLLGLLLAWTYYKSGSLTPCIFMHILYNSSSVYLTRQHPEIENIEDLFSSAPAVLLLVVMALLFAAGISAMKYLIARKQAS